MKKAVSFAILDVRIQRRRTVWQTKKHAATRTRVPVPTLAARITENAATVWRITKRAAVCRCVCGNLHRSSNFHAYGLSGAGFPGQEARHKKPRPPLYRRPGFLCFRVVIAPAPQRLFSILDRGLRAAVDAAQTQYALILHPAGTAIFQTDRLAGA